MPNKAGAGTKFATYFSFMGLLSFSFYAFYDFFIRRIPYWYRLGKQSPPPCGYQGGAGDYTLMVVCELPLSAGWVPILPCRRTAAS
jgi:hypothetical protein